MAQMAIGYIRAGQYAVAQSHRQRALIALIGKWWITRSAALLVVRIRSLGLPETETEQRIKRQGGVSWLGPIILLLFSVAVGVAIGVAIAMRHH